MFWALLSLWLAVMFCHMAVWCALVFTNRRGGQWDSVSQLIAVCSAREESSSPYTTAAFGSYAWTFRFAPLSLMWRFRVSEWGKCGSLREIYKKHLRSVLTLYAVDIIIFITFKFWVLVFSQWLILSLSILLWFLRASSVLLHLWEYKMVFGSSSVAVYSSLVLLKVALQLYLTFKESIK